MGLKTKQPPDFTAMTSKQLEATYHQHSDKFTRLLRKVNKHQTIVDTALAETAQLGSEQDTILSILEARDFDSLMIDNEAVH